MRGIPTILGTVKGIVRAKSATDGEFVRGDLCIDVLNITILQSAHGPSYHQGLLRTLVTLEI